ncbi:ATP-binding SpoIIE family protein phosphatase [Motilibacter peucedani]|uniref:ATP-binding SpoIIE family protein phosphatase n=1 Tax=Motilibacter peucedani TaxID=598650 RepID=UPI0011C4AC6F|nr:ATP-binding SpoIIE family protein phosphatase [Motilibacter peucedani]
MPGTSAGEPSGRRQGPGGDRVDALGRCARLAAAAASAAEVLEAAWSALGPHDLVLLAPGLGAPLRRTADGLEPAVLEVAEALGPEPQQLDGLWWVAERWPSGGLLAAGSTQRPGPDDLAMLSAVGQVCGLALAGLRLRRTVEAAAAFGAARDRAAVLAALTGLLVPACGQWCAVHLLDASRARLELAAVAHADPAEQQALEAFLDGFPVSLAAAGTPVVPAPDALTVPLGALGSSFGSVTVCDPGRPLPPAVVELVEEVARHAAVALHHAAGIAASRSVAESLQRALLPGSLPELPGVEVAAHYAPGGSGARGDWYDAFELPGGRLGFAVGDTMGRGVAAAAAMGQARAALRGFALEGHGPAELLRRLDGVVSAFDEPSLTTCVYAVYDPVARRMTAACAGHLPPLLVDGDGGGYLDVEVGVPLGAGGMRPGAYADTVVTVHPGTTVLLFTDGLLRHFGGAAGADGRTGGQADGLVEGAEGARAAVLRAAGGAVDRPVAELVERVLREVPGGADAPDDVALVALRAAVAEPVDPAGARSLEIELPASLQAARIARARVLAALTGWGHGGSDDAGGPGGFEAVDAVVLLTDELVTNAVVHAQSPLRLQVRATGTYLRVSVTDESPRLPSPRGNGVEEGSQPLDAVPEGGRGLRLVDLLASRWGVEPLPVGKRIWFEVELHEPDPR